MTATRSNVRSVPSDRLFTPLGGLVLGIVVTLAAFWIPFIIALL